MRYWVTLQRNNTVHVAGPEKARVHSHAITLDASRRAAALEQWRGTHPPEPLKFVCLLLLRVLNESGSSGKIKIAHFFVFFVYTCPLLPGGRLKNARILVASYHRYPKRSGWLRKAHELLAPMWSDSLKGSGRLRQAQKGSETLHPNVIRFLEGSGSLTKAQEGLVTM